MNVISNILLGICVIFSACGTTGKRRGRDAALVSESSVANFSVHDEKYSACADIFGSSNTGVVHADLEKQGLTIPQKKPCSLLGAIGQCTIQYQDSGVRGHIFYYDPRTLDGSVKKAACLALKTTNITASYIPTRVLQTSLFAPFAVLFSVVSSNACTDYEMGYKEMQETFSTQKGYAPSPCSVKNAIGRCNQTTSQSLQSSFVTYKGDGVTAAKAEQDCLPPLDGKAKFVSF